MNAHTPQNSAAPESSQLAGEKWVEIDPASLLASMHGEVELGAIWKPGDGTLPLGDRLTPSGFERLITRLAVADEPDMRLQAFRFGKSGNAQGGIDVIAFEPRTGLRRCYEGKRVWEIYPKDLIDWVGAFLDGPHSKDCRTFTLCTTYPVDEKQSLILEWERQMKRLQERGIEGHLWHNAVLQDLLRGQYQLVCEIAGRAVADEFCTSAHVESASLNDLSFPAREVQIGPRQTTIKNVTVEGVFVLPRQSSLSPTGILNFARRDLRGVSVSLSSDEIVAWTQWRTHARHDEHRPYAVRSEQGYVFTSGSARLQLDAAEVADLDWLIANLWKPLIDAARLRVTAWRSGAFEHLRNQYGEMSVVLGAVGEDLWRLLLLFSKAHDYTTGTSPWHIFDGSSRTLVKVFTKGNSKDRKPGYHAIMEVKRDSTFWAPNADSLRLIWNDGLPGAESTEFSPAGAWDAAYTHDWFINELVPAAVAWAAKEKQWPFQRLGAAESQRLRETLLSDAYSLAIPGADLRLVPSSGAEEFLECVHALQRHFNGLHSSVPVANAAWVGILQAVERLLNFCKAPDSYYISSCLSLRSGEPLSSAIGQFIASTKESASSWNIDLALRCLISTAERMSAVPASELRYAADRIQPIFDRFQEDLICSHISNSSYGR